MLFIVKSDFYTYIPEAQLDKLTGSSNTVWELEATRTIEYFKSFFRPRYDVDVMFDPFQDFVKSATRTYAVGDRIYHLDTMYYCIQEATDIDITDTDYFTVGDNRNQDLLSKVLDVLLYNIYSRLNSVDIPTIRKERYDGNDSRQTGGAVGWLKMVVKGQIQPDFPLVEANQTDQTGNVVMYGSASDSLERNQVF